MSSQHGDKLTTAGELPNGTWYTHSGHNDNSKQNFVVHALHTLAMIYSKVLHWLSRQDQHDFSCLQMWNGVDY